MGGDTESKRMKELTRFQSTPPHGGRRPPFFCLLRFTQCFNPRPRMGGDAISMLLFCGFMGFNPRPRMGGDFFHFFYFFYQVFQSTPPHGGRQHILPYGEYGNTVSIHAPAWGATEERQKVLYKTGSFNPRPRMGGDDREGRLENRPRSFNPRPRMGGDRLEENSMIYLRVFQSTPPHGGRPLDFRIYPQTPKVSIHAPAWGATIFSTCADCPQIVSIHAPAWGATSRAPSSCSNPVFQSTPPHGGRRWKKGTKRMIKMFQSTPPHGGRQPFSAHI